MEGCGDFGGEESDVAGGGLVGCRLLASCRVRKNESRDRWERRGGWQGSVLCIESWSAGSSLFDCAVGAAFESRLLNRNVPARSSGNIHPRPAI